jgi:hypothetical protein
MPDGDKKIAITLPGEWVLQKVFGPALTEFGEDLKKLYAKGRDKLVAAAYRKIKDPEDGKQANLRVTRDVLWMGHSPRTKFARSTLVESSLPHVAPTVKMTTLSSSSMSSSRCPRASCDFTTSSTTVSTRPS